jgi:RNA polymerase I-specific transcription initiation factor RRN3
MPWTTSPNETFIKSYVNFVGMLVSARTEWVNIVVASAIKRLTHRTYYLPDTDQSAHASPL